jgi:predicted TIM-barrel fold metal-dependent hydrolase
MVLGEERLMIVSADGHAAPHPETYRPYLPTKYHADLDGLLVENEEWCGFTPTRRSYSDETLELIDTDMSIRSGGLEGVYDVGRRLMEMDREGIAAEIVISGAHNATSPFFSVVNRPYSLELQMVGAQVYNRWVSDCMTESHGRLFAVGYPGPGADMHETLAELEWLAEHGFRAVSLPGSVDNPEVPSIDSPAFDPFWRACEQFGLVLLVHAGYGNRQGQMVQFLRQIDAATRGMTREEVNEVFRRWPNSPFGFDVRPRQAMWRLMLGGAFDRFPGLKLALTEVRGDWVPATIAMLDAKFERGDTPLQRTPSEYWRTNCFAGLSFIHRAEVEQRYEIGVDQIMFGRDYPHPEGTWPNTIDWLRDAFVGVPRDEASAMLGGNAIRCYGLDGPRLRSIADRVGPPVESVLQPRAPVSQALIADFDTRGGYLKPVETIPDIVREEFEQDVRRVLARNG